MGVVILSTLSLYSEINTCIWIYNVLVINLPFPVYENKLHLICSSISFQAYLKRTNRLEIDLKWAKSTCQVQNPKILILVQNFPFPPLFTFLIQHTCFLLLQCDLCYILFPNFRRGVSVFYPFQCWTQILALS